MRVLVVEDEAPLRDQIVDALRVAGHAVDETGEGREALYMGNEYPVDVVVYEISEVVGDGRVRLRFPDAADPYSLGEMPLPPYIRRDDGPADTPPVRTTSCARSP